MRIVGGLRRRRRKVGGRVHSVRRLGALSSAVPDQYRRGFALSDGISFDEERDIYKSAGYPRKLSFKDYWERFSRGDIAATICKAYPYAIWSRGINVVDESDPDEPSDFNLSLSELASRLRLWPTVMQAHVLASVGRYAVIVIGLRGQGDLSLPASIVQSSQPVLYLSVYSEGRAIIGDIVGQRKGESSEPRYGLPKFYKINMQGGSGDVKTHWSRVIHVASGTLQDSIYGEPILRSVWNRLIDLEKIVASGAEASWINSSRSLHVNIDPSMNVRDEHLVKMEESLEDHRHDFGDLLTWGSSVSSLRAPNFNFNPNTLAILRLISSSVRIPVRILAGSERGELASSQDRNNFNDRQLELTRLFAEPLVRDIIDRFILLGVLPAPLGSYRVMFPDVDDMTPLEKVGTVDSIALANHRSMQSGLGPVMTVDEIRREFLDMEPLDFENATADGSGDGSDDGGTSVRADSINREQEIINLVSDTRWVGVASSILQIWGGLDAALLVTHHKDTTLDNLDTRIGELFDEIQEFILESALSILVETGTLISDLATDNEGFSAGQEFEISFDSDHVLVSEWAANYAASTVTQILPDTRDAINDVISRSFDDGLSRSDRINAINEVIGLRTDQVRAADNLALRLRNAAPGSTVSYGSKSVKIPKGGATETFINLHASRYRSALKRGRAELISRTLVNRSANEGLRQSWVQARDRGLLPPDAKRKWIVTDDDLLRDSHREMDGQIQPLDSGFVSPEGKRIEPGEEARCRCSQVLVFP